MSNTNDDTNMTGNADNCDPLRTKSGQEVSGTVHASIAFRSRDEAITALFLQVFGASPVFPDPLPSPTIPANCRNALRDAGKAYPRSGCAVCGDGGLRGCPYEKTPPAERQTPDVTYALECQTERMGEMIDDLARELAEVKSQRDAAHQKCRDYRLVALGAEDALEKMTAKRDALAEALGKMLSAFNIMESSEERDAWESAHSVWFLMKGDTNSIDALVNRFLSWKLPESVMVDRIAYEPAGHFDRYGTNLLSASEAKQMIEHLLGVKIQIDESVPDDTVIIKEPT